MASVTSTVPASTAAFSPPETAITKQKTSLCFSLKDIVNALEKNEDYKASTVGIIPIANELRQQLDELNTRTAELEYVVNILRQFASCKSAVNSAGESDRKFAALEPISLLASLHIDSANAITNFSRSLLFVFEQEYLEDAKSRTRLLQLLLAHVHKQVHNVKQLRHRIIEEDTEALIEEYSRVQRVTEQLQLDEHFIVNRYFLLVHSLLQCIIQQHDRGCNRELYRLLERVFLGIYYRPSGTDQKGSSSPRRAREETPQPSTASSSSSSTTKSTSKTTPTPRLSSTPATKSLKHVERLRKIIERNHFLDIFIRLLKEYQQFSATIDQYLTKQCDVECAFCLSEIDIFAEKALIPNSCVNYDTHAFHESCAKEWIAKNKTCPMCRTPCSSFVIHTIKPQKQPVCEKISQC